MNAKVYFSENKPGILEKNKNFCLKIILCPLLNTWQLINFVGTLGMQLIFFLKQTERKNKICLKKKKRALNILIKHRNVKVCVNDTDKNLGPLSADKSDVIKECHRQ